MSCYEVEIRDDAAPSKETGERAVGEDGVLPDVRVWLFMSVSNAPCRPSWSSETVPPHAQALHTASTTSLTVSSVDLALRFPILPSARIWLSLTAVVRRRATADLMALPTVLSNAIGRQVLGPWGSSLAFPGFFNTIVRGRLEWAGQY